MRPLNLDQLASWVALVESRSFRGAAQIRALSQPTITQHVQRLEAHLGARLVERGNRGCAPTVAGRRLLPIARSLLRVAEHASWALSAPPRLAACSNIGVFLLPPLLADFYGGQPKLSLRIGTNPEVLDMLETGLADIGLLEWWTPRPDLIAIPWRREAVVAIVANTHAWAGRRFITLSELRDAPLIGGEPGTGTGRLLRQNLPDGTPWPAPVMELGSTEAVKRAVAAGLGVSVVLALASIQETKDKRLVALTLKPKVHKTLWLARRSDFDHNAPLFQYLVKAASSAS